MAGRGRLPGTIIRILTGTATHGPRTPRAYTGAFSSGRLCHNPDACATLCSYGTAREPEIIRPATDLPRESGHHRRLSRLLVVGYTPQVVTGVWGRSRQTQAGGGVSPVAPSARPIWGRFMRSAHGVETCHRFREADTVVSMPVMRPEGRSGRRFRAWGGILHCSSRTG